MDRKEIVKALSEHFAVKPIYLGAPSLAYRIETGIGIYSIDRLGKITTVEGVEVELGSLLAGSAVVEQYESQDQVEPVYQIASEAPVEPAALSNDAFEVAVDLEGHTGLTLRNLVNLIYNKQALIRKSLGIEGDIIEGNFATIINEANVDTLDNFKTAIAAISGQYCPGITFDFDSRMIIFKFLQGEHSPDKINAYRQLITLLSQTAKILKYTSAKPNDTDNAKFTFRLFLIRIGMVGMGYKTARRVLLEKLEGNSAFRNGSKSEKGSAEISEV